MENKRSLGILIGVAVLLAAGAAVWYLRRPAPQQAPQAQTQATPCLLYTSDAADE